MKTFSYDRDTVAVFEFLKDNLPHRIYTNKFERVVFDYGNFHFIAEPDAFRGVSQDEGCEVLLADFKRIDSMFQPSIHDELMFKDKAIARIWILRTLLYFTEDAPFDRKAEALKEPHPVIANLIRTSSTAHEEIICHPDSEEAKSINREFANLVDAGIMLEIDGQRLMCFSWGNGFGIVGNTMSIDELEAEVVPEYKFIEV